MYERKIFSEKRLGIEIIRSSLNTLIVNYKLIVTHSKNIIIK